MKVHCKQEGLNSAISTGGNLTMFIYHSGKEKIYYNLLLQKTLLHEPQTSAGKTMTSICKMPWIVEKNNTDLSLATQQQINWKKPMLQTAPISRARSIFISYPLWVNVANQVAGISCSCSAEP